MLPREARGREQVRIGLRILIHSFDRIIYISGAPGFTFEGVQIQVIKVYSLKARII